MVSLTALRTTRQLLAAWAANPNYPSVFFPPGKYAFAGNVTYPGHLPRPVSLIGSGADTTELTWPKGGGLTFNCTGPASCVTASNMSFTVGVRDGSSGIKVMQETPLGGPQARPQNNFSNLTFRGASPTNFWTTAIYVGGLSVINFVNVLVTGDASVGYPTVGAGVNLTGSITGVVYNFTNCNINNVGNGIILGPEVQGVNVSGCNFVGCTNGVLGSTATKDIDQVTIANSQFNCQSCGIAAVPGVQLGNLLVNGNLFLLPDNATGILLNLDASTTIIGNIFQFVSHSNAQQVGVSVANTQGSVGGLMTGNRFWGLRTGWILQPTTNNWNVQSNVYVSNNNNFTNGNVSNMVGKVSA